MGELNQNKFNGKQEQHQSSEWNDISNQFQSYERDHNCAQTYNNLQDNQFYQISTNMQGEISPSMVNINDSSAYSSTLLGQNHIRFLQPVDRNGVVLNNVISNQISNQNFVENITYEFQTNNLGSNNNSYLPNEINNHEKINQMNSNIQNVPIAKQKKVRKNLKDILKAEPLLQNQVISNTSQPTTKTRSISSIFSSENKINSNSCSFMKDASQSVYQIPVNIENYQQIPQLPLVVNNSNDNQMIFNHNKVFFLILVFKVHKTIFNL